MNTKKLARGILTLDETLVGEQQAKRRAGGPENSLAGRQNGNQAERHQCQQTATHHPDRPEPVIRDTAKRGADAGGDVQDDPEDKTYDSIPLLEQTKLPRGGISIETKAVGMVQVR